MPVLARLLGLDLAHTRKTIRSKNKPTSFYYPASPSVKGSWRPSSRRVCWGTVSLKRQAVRGQILRAAADLFRERGYRATTLDDIAAHLGMSKASLYGYFAAKEGILAAISRETMEMFSRGLAEISRRRLPPREKLRQVVHHHVELVLTHRSFLTVFFSEEASFPGPFARQMAREKDRYDRGVERIIREGIRQGVFREVPGRLAVYALLGMVNWLYKWCSPAGPLRADEIAQAYLDFIERGILTPKTFQGPRLRRRILGLRRELDALGRMFTSHTAS